MSKNKQVVLLSFEMLEPGGINRVISGFQTGFSKLGYDVITYHLSANGGLHVNSEDYTLQTKWFRPKALNLGWNNKSQLSEYASSVKNADFVFSIHGAPHPTKSGAKGDYGWHNIYKIPKKLGIPVGILFTDNLWDRLYKWIEDVIDKDVKLLYNNYNAQFDSIEKLQYDAQYIDYPIDFDESLPPVNKTIDVAWLPQIKKWKGIYEFISQLSCYPNTFYTVIFNSGIEYYNMRNGEVWDKAIRYEHRPRTGQARNTRNYFEKILHNKNSTTDYFGLVYPDQVNQIYARSKVSIDLSGGFAKKFESQFTCSMTEAMLHNSIVAAPPQLADEKSRIHGLDIVYPVELNNIIDSLEEIINDNKKRKQITSRAYEWLYRNCKDTTVAKKIENYMKG